MCILTQKLSHVYKNGESTSNCSDSTKLVVEKSSQECHHVDTDVFSDNSSNKLLKFMLLYGLLTFQDTYPAAASDLASGLSSLPILGDLGDLSTGFASVSKISLSLLWSDFFRYLKQSIQ